MPYSSHHSVARGWLHESCRDGRGWLGAFEVGSVNSAASKR
jgi:hypothetical protein